MITCPVCDRTSHSPVDELVGWCGACETFTRGDSREQILAAADRLAEGGEPWTAEAIRRRVYAAFPDEVVWRVAASRLDAAFVDRLRGLRVAFGAELFVSADSAFAELVEEAASKHGVVLERRPGGVG